MKPYQYARAEASIRPKSEDLAQVFERDDVLVVALADGGGGMRSGRAASRGLVAIVESAVNDRGFLLETTQPWLDLFHSIDRSLASNEAGQTTGVVVVVGPRGLIGVSAGNSEAWVVTPNSTENLTVG